MRRLIFATNNRHKLKEVRSAMGAGVEIVGLTDVGLGGEIPETADTLEGNALQKAEWAWARVASRSDIDGVFADDTGLEVDALGGAPGVYSARYAGEHCSFDDNIDKLLTALADEPNRRAAFLTVICLITKEDAEAPVYFEGKVEGKILTERYSNGEGFGYDPIFMPDRFAVSFAEMPVDVKNLISHRGVAVKKLSQYLAKWSQ